MEQIVKLDKVPYVQLVITNSSGDVLGVPYGGDNPVLAQTLRICDQKADFPVDIREDTVAALGQDCYTVDKEFVLSVCGVFLSSSWASIVDLKHSLPSGAIYTFVVSY